MIIGISGPDLDLVSSLFNDVKQYYKDSLLYIEKPSEKFLDSNEGVLIVNLTKHLSNLSIEYKKHHKLAVLHCSTLLDSIAYTKFFTLKEKNNKTVNVHISNSISNNFESSFLKNYDLVFFCQPQNTEEILLNEYNILIEKIKNKVVVLSGSKEKQFKDLKKILEKNNIKEKS